MAESLACLRLKSESPVPRLIFPPLTNQPYRFPLIFISWNLKAEENRSCLLPCLAVPSVDSTEGSHQAGEGPAGLLTEVLDIYRTVCRAVHVLEVSSSKNQEPQIQRKYQMKAQGPE